MPTWSWTGPVNPKYTPRVGIQRPPVTAPAPAQSDVADAIAAIDRILRCTVGRPKIWQRVDDLLDHRLALRAQRPLSVPVIPGRPS